ncbi:IMPACT family protein [Litorihabitans aurantiacus]|uniref:YigZ family protein n=1 Tax=Litorihabitans aurantiacus TaxID=1930061 RepID=A0AA37XB74_9MICO|nr:YigZ family protein [Litorihabitans aurantiacus]GMA30794.1 YigZ family protein [Litorihabitans aurantiacus]
MTEPPPRDATTEGPTSYTTLRRDVVVEREISRSRFLTFLSPVPDEPAARERIADVRALHPRARHHVTAMILGPRRDLERSNDDGEPSGTGGAPMLDALRAAGVSDVVAIVVRYFGGVLLGTGGLARAYRGGVVDALAQASLRRRTLLRRHAVRASYAQAAAIEAEARRRGWVLEATYGEEVELLIDADPDRTGEVHRVVERASAGAAGVRDVGERWV